MTNDIQNEKVVYAPDVVGVGRMFMIALKVPSEAPEVTVAMPEGMTMFDHTSPAPLSTGGIKGGAKSEIRRFYFRAFNPMERAEIRFALPDGEVVVPVEVWAFEALRKYRSLKDVTLPRRWPLGKPLPELKERQTVTTPAGIEALRGNPGAAPVWLEMSDDAIWAMQPDSTIPRWHWVNLPHGCPVHGTEIYRKAPYYPWGKDTSTPWGWKIRCPVGGELYPSNDFANGDMTSGEFPDDGVGGGCLPVGEGVPPLPAGGKGGGTRYGFIAEICQAYCHQMLRVAPECAQGYLATGDLRYVHKALVAFCRLAVEYAYLATMTHHRHRNSVSQVERFGQGTFQEGPCLARSGFTVYCIDQPGYQMRHAEAYDRIFPAIDQVPDIIPFLRGKGYPVQTHEGVRRFIEENLFAVWMQGSMDGACQSNEPYVQRGLARTAEALNYAHGTDFMDWLYDGEGKMRVFVPNAFFRDGAPYESTGGYNGIHVSALGPIIDSIEHLRGLRPDAYPESQYPRLNQSRRYRNIFDFDMDTVTIERSYPAIGDTGSHPAYRKLSKITWQSGGVQAFEHAYRLFRDPKLAWALAHHSGWQPSIGFPFSREEIEREAAKWPDDWNDRSTLHDGYGIAILRGGTGDDKRAFWLRYGRARGHVQDDIMDIGLQGYQGVLLSQMGYPRNWGYWEHCWMTHNVARQIPFQQMTAQAQLFADAGPVQVAEAYAQAFIDEVDAEKGYRLLDLPPGLTSPPTPLRNGEGREPARGESSSPPSLVGKGAGGLGWQRRMIALVDVGPDRFYCVDFYRIAGGREHWWCFHAQEGDFTTNGLSLTVQPGGTLAGPDVPYGDPKWLEANGCQLGSYGWSGPMFGFAHLYNVARGTSPPTPPAPLPLSTSVWRGGRGVRGEVWSADWALKNADGLHLRLTVPSAEGAEVVICDGKSPAGGSPYEMKWILLHHPSVTSPPAPPLEGRGDRREGEESNAPVQTQVLSIIEPYVNTPFIQEVLPLKPSGGDEAGFASSGCVLRMADRTDTVLVSAEPHVERTVEGGLRFAGRFGLYAEHEGVPVAMVLVGGTHLAKGDFGIRLDSPEYRAKIIKVDRATETITVSPAPPDLNAMVGIHIFVTNSVRRSAYKVLESKTVPHPLTPNPPAPSPSPPVGEGRGEGEVAELRLDLDSRIGTGRVTGVDDFRVNTSTPFPLHRFRYYHGARLVNADRTAEYRLIEVRDKGAAFIDAEVHPEAKAGQIAVAFPKNTWFDVYDYGVGDEVVWPYAVSVTRVSPCLYRVVAPIPVTITLPSGSRMESGNLA